MAILLFYPRQASRIVLELRYRLFSNLVLVGLHVSFSMPGVNKIPLIWVDFFSQGMAQQGEVTDVLFPFHLWSPVRHLFFSMGM